MLYEFAMTPDLFDGRFIREGEASETVLLEILTSLADTGLLADLQKGKWKRDVANRVETLPPNLKIDVQECLILLCDRNRIVKHPKSMDRDPISEQDWVDIAFDCHSKSPFHGIILRDEMKSQQTKYTESLISFLKTLRTKQWVLQRKRTMTVKKTSEEHRKALSPILRYAKEITLIDPYINAKECVAFEIVELCSEMLGKVPLADQRYGKINIHTEIKNQKSENYIELWKEKIHKIYCRNKHKFQVFFWDKTQSSQHLHDRFIITDQCGIGAQAGFDARKNSTVWNLLDENEKAYILKKHSESGQLVKMVYP